MDNLDNKWNGWYMKQQLDYMVYSLCEQCCDNMPRYANQGQYWWRKRAGKLFDLTRGNAMAHFFYDLCTLFPNIKFMKSKWMVDKYYYFDVCKKMKQWTEGHENWKDLYEQDLDWVMKGVLSDAMIALQCGAEDTWMRCVGVEKKQKRI